MWHQILASQTQCELFKLSDHLLARCSENSSWNLIFYSMFSFYSWECLTSNLASAFLSPPKPKDPAAAPAPGRNSSQAAPGQSQAQATAGSHQLSVGPTHNSAGPSPHTVRRGKSPPLLRALGEGCANLPRSVQGSG